MAAATRQSCERRKVLLVNPNQMKPPVIPIALDYLADALRESGFRVDVLDLCFSGDYSRDIAEYFGRNEVLAVAVTMRNSDDTSFATRDFCIARYKGVVDCLKGQTSAPIILGGSGFSIAPQQVLEYCGVDLGVWGEGEFSLPDMVGKIASNKDWSDVPGLVYRTKGGFHGNPAHYIDLSRVSAQDRSAVDNRRYFVEGGMGAVETKRGCPKKCIYCVDPVGKGRTVRLRSPRSVGDEVQALLNMGIDHLHLCDSEFNIPERHAREVCRELVARGLGERVRWYTYATPAGFSRELAALLRKAGCVGINFGVDSGCDSMLKTLGRDFSVADLSQTADACRKEGIITMFDLLLGGLGETRETLSQTIETMKGLSPDRVGASLGVRVFPQTKLADLARGQGPLDSNPNLHGAVTGNGNFFAPVFYLSSELGTDVVDYLAKLVGGDERFFFFGTAQGADRNYNYNDNTVLAEAIKAGYHGAFWDILRRLSHGQGRCTA